MPNELPDKNETVLLSSMEGEQRKLYAAWAADSAAFAKYNADFILIFNQSVDKKSAQKPYMQAFA